MQGLGFFLDKVTLRSVFRGTIRANSIAVLYSAVQSSMFVDIAGHKAV